MKRVIVNADDFGADPSRNDGIVEAVEAGVVSSISILANTPFMAETLGGITRIRSSRISFGAHINLSEGRPLSHVSRFLVDGDGTFHGKVVARKILLKKSDRQLEKEVEDEVRAQIGFLIGMGVPVSHLDGHQHIHVLPAVLRAVISVAKEFGIRWIRLPEENPSARMLRAVPEGLFAEGRRFSKASRHLRHLCRTTGINTTEHFRGLFLKDRLSLPTLEDTLHEVPEGLTEIMVHPGRRAPSSTMGPFSRFSTAARERELAVLLDPHFKTLLSRYDISVVPFPEVRS